MYEELVGADELRRALAIQLALQSGFTENDVLKAAPDFEKYLKGEEGQNDGN